MPQILPVGIDRDEQGIGDGEPLPGHPGQGVTLAAHTVAVPGLDPVEGQGEAHGRGLTSMTFWNLVTMIQRSTSTRKSAHDGARTNSSRKGNFAM